MFINYNRPFIGVYEYEIGHANEIKIPIQRGKKIAFSHLTFAKMAGLIEHVNRIKPNYQPVIPGLAENIDWSSIFPHIKRKFAYYIYHGIHFFWHQNGPNDLLEHQRLVLGSIYALDMMFFNFKVLTLTGQM